MSIWQNKTHVVPFTHPSWDSQSKWWFAKVKTQDDDELIAARTSNIEFEDYDHEAARKARKAGKRYVPKFSQETLMSGNRALILTMSRKIEGPDFVVPDDFPEMGADGQPVINPLNNEPKLHPYAGRIPPVDSELVGTLDPDLVEDIVTFLDQQYAGRSDAEQAQFPEGDSVSLRPEASGDEVAGEVPVSV